METTDSSLGEEIFYIEDYEPVPSGASGVWPFDSYPTIDYGDSTGHFDIVLAAQNAKIKVDKELDSRMWAVLELEGSLTEEEAYYLDMCVRFPDSRLGKPFLEAHGRTFDVKRTDVAGLEDINYALLHNTFYQRKDTNIAAYMSIPCISVPPNVFVEKLGGYRLPVNSIVSVLKLVVPWKTQPSLPFIGLWYSPLVKRTFLIMYPNSSNRVSVSGMADHAMLVISTPPPDDFRWKHVVAKYLHFESTKSMFCTRQIFSFAPIDFDDLGAVDVFIYAIAEERRDMLLRVTTLDNRPRLEFDGPGLRGKWLLPPVDGVEISQFELALVNCV